MKQQAGECLQSDANFGQLAQKSKKESIQQFNDFIEQIRQKTVEEILRQHNRRDFLVRTGLSFEITDYFKFEDRQHLQQEKTYFKFLYQRSYIPWIILIISVLSTAIVPPWLMSIEADKYLRVSWKCFLQCLTTFPFVFYEMRSKNQRTINQYKLSHILKFENLKKVWLLAFTTSFWPTAILITIQWTYVSHCFVLGSLSNLFLSFERLFQGRAGGIEKAGQIVAVFGIFFVFYDTISLDVSKVTEYEWDVQNPFYLTRPWWQRLLGDLGALTIGFCISQLSKQTSDVKQYFPPYLLLVLNNFFTCIFMIFSAYFFNGATFNDDTEWGVFGLFTAKHFSNFLYLSILLGMSAFITLTLVSRLFPDPLIIAIAMTMEPIISTFLWHIVGVQTLPGPFTWIGYLLIIPGIIVILTGNCILIYRNKRDQQRISLMEVKQQMQEVTYDNKY